MVRRRLSRDSRMWHIHIPTGITWHRFSQGRERISGFFSLGQQIGQPYRFYLLAGLYVAELSPNSYKESMARDWFVLKPWTHRDIRWFSIAPRKLHYRCVNYGFTRLKSNAHNFSQKKATNKQTPNLLSINICQIGINAFNIWHHINVKSLHSALGDDFYA